ncbi:MAG: hypothetical protein NTW87_11215 [Planctomycetota bacterium]|nr:hypothetical protein [Planctomycetota bacterium]
MAEIPLNVQPHLPADVIKAAFAWNTALAQPSGVTLRRSALSSLGGSMCILLPRTGSTGFGGGWRNPPPAQR